MKINKLKKKVRLWFRGKVMKRSNIK